MTTSSKDLEAFNKAAALIAADEMEKSEYSHREGSSLYPKYYYKDDMGNYRRGVNAPAGHEDYQDYLGDDDGVDPLAPDQAPQFYTQDGRKMSRAPYSGADVEWNPNYHNQDPKNLWASRWVNPVNGEHEYSYIDSDLRDNQAFRINRENALTDNRLPYFRQYVVALFRSSHQKDRTVATILALLDQGRLRVRELMSLRVGDVRLSRDIIRLGRRIVHADQNLISHLGTLTSNRLPNEPLFVVPKVGQGGDLNYEEQRRIGPYFVVNLLEELGIPAESLQTYHASQTYSMALQRLLSNSYTNYMSAHYHALREVAAEMGHRLDAVDDPSMALQAIEQAAVDPLVVMAIKRACEDGTVDLNGPDMPEGSLHDAIPRVSMVLSGRTEDEEEFSYWLRTVALHDYMEDPGASAPNPM